MFDWFTFEWRYAGAVSAALTAVLGLAKALRSSSVAKPPFWRRLFQVGSAIVRLHIVEGEVDYLKLALSDARSERDWERAERIRIQGENNSLRAELRKHRSDASEASGADSSAGRTNKRGASTRKRRTTSGTSGESDR